MSFCLARPVIRCTMADWISRLVLAALLYTLFVSAGDNPAEDVISLIWVTLKSVFVLTLATVRRRLYIHAFRLAPSWCCIGIGKSWISQEHTYPSGSLRWLRKSMQELMWIYLLTQSELTKLGRCLPREHMVARRHSKMYFQLCSGDRQECSKNSYQRDLANITLCAVVVFQTVVPRQPQWLSFHLWSRWIEAMIMPNSK